MAREIKKHCVNTEETLFLSDKIIFRSGVNAPHKSTVNHYFAQSYNNMIGTDVFITHDPQYTDANINSQLYIEEEKITNTFNLLRFYPGYCSHAISNYTPASFIVFDRLPPHSGYGMVISYFGEHRIPRLWINKYTSVSTIASKLKEQYEDAREYFRKNYNLRDSIEIKEDQRYYLDSIEKLFFSYLSLRYPVFCVNPKLLISELRINNQIDFKIEMRDNPTPFMKDAGTHYEPLVHEYQDNSKFIDYLLSGKYKLNKEQFKSLVLWALALQPPKPEISEISNKVNIFTKIRVPSLEYKNLGVGFTKLFKFIEMKLFPREILDIREILNKHFDVENNPEKIEIVREVIKDYYYAMEDLRSNIVSSLNFFFEGGFLVKSITGGIYFTTDFFRMKKEFFGLLEWSRPGEYLNADFVKCKVKTHGRISRIKPSKAYYYYKGE
jgi:hypothetical protein